MLAAFRSLRPDIEGVPFSIKPQAGFLCDSQQRSRDTAQTLQLSRVAHISRDIDRVFPRGGEARGDVTGRSGRLAPRALGRAAITSSHTPRTRPPQRPQPPRQDLARQERGTRPLRHYRPAPAEGLLRYNFS